MQWKKKTHRWIVGFLCTGIVSAGWGTMGLAAEQPGGAGATPTASMRTTEPGQVTAAPPTVSFRATAPQGKPDRPPTLARPTGVEVGPGESRAGGDTCATATVIGALPFSDADTTCRGTHNYDEICPYDNPGAPDLVYQYSTPVDQVVDITLCANSSYDTKLYVYQNVCAAPAIACSDDICSTPSYPNPYVSQVTSVNLTGGNVYYIVVDGYGPSDCGTYTIDVTSSTPCDVVIPPGATLENEPNCGLPTDYVNGGCNSTPPVFSPISCGETVAGTGAYDGSSRDTDWYQLVLSQPTDVTWTAEAEFDLLIGIVDNGGVADCTGVSQLLVYNLAPPCTSVSVTASLGAGTWWLFAAPQFTSAVTCGKEYVATVTCVGGPSCIPPGQDCWSTQCGGTKTDFSATPIPAGFFDLGSQPFDGVITLRGAGGFIDTVVQRQGSLCFSEPLPSTAAVPIELVQLNLVSCAPITVPGSGLWDVQVGLSTVQPPMGIMTAAMVDSNGGTFDSQFWVQPVYIFSRVGSPSDQRIFDTAAQGIPPALLETSGTAWSTIESLEFCSHDGFAGGVTDDGTGQPCCKETCHGVSGDPTPCDPSEGHCHCTTPPECPPCLEACCLPWGACILTTASDCQAQGGEAQGPGSICLGDADGDGLDDACKKQPCAECGPGAHWIDTPACPAGLDQMPSAALVGIDTNFDCVQDTSMILSGPVTVRRVTGPIDDSTGFPGLRPIDGHLDVIDTEIISMSLTGGGVILTAGAGQGAIPLAASLGAIAEQPGDPSLADSFFDVFFEVDLGGGQRAYNQMPLRIDSVINCVPPNATYIHPVGCIPLYDSPSGGVLVANLVTANHDTYPLPGACCLTDGTCIEMLGGECQASGGNFQGEGTTCATTTCPGCIPSGQDCWSTACGGATKASFVDNPIPANFFDSGSQPFSGVIPLGGDIGTADTVLQRLGPMCFPEPLPATASVPIELVQLSLTSCEPIQVQGSQGSGRWDVRVGLSGAQPTGSLTVTKESADGGTFSASFFVQPVYTFTRWDAPHDVRVFDTVTEGIPPVLLQTVGNASWLASDELSTACANDGFAAGVTKRFGEPCCEETCHATSGDPTPCDPSEGHCHCTTPPGCPKCPEDIGACCLPTGQCVDGVTESQCTAMGGQHLGSGSICLTVPGRDVIPTIVRKGDYDDDCDVDLVDYRALVNCFTGPTGTYVAGCERGDFNDNGHIDLSDFGEFQVEYLRPDPRCPVSVPAGDDCWTTPCQGGETMFDCCNNPIPAEFFEPGSLPFVGTIRLGSATSGAQDTIMRRLAPMTFQTLCSPAETPIELVYLNLSSCEPIAVELEGGGFSYWHVHAALSQTAAPLGTMTAIKTYGNGGVFDSSFYVQPVFTFINVGTGDVRVLDTGAQGTPAFLLETADMAPWVHQLEPGSPVQVCGEGFAPGVEGSPGRQAQCCKLIGHAGPGHIHQTAPPDCSQCPKGACCNPTTGACFIALDQSDCTAQGGQYKGDGTNCNDNDGDRIPDVFENNNCCGPRDLCNTGTNPNNPDTDGDGISDGDEVYGTLAGLNLPALGANPCHKDIFVEVDWTDDAIGGPAHTHRPTAAAVALIVAAFAAAPVANPDAVTGITLHVDYGQGPAPYTGGNLIPGSPAFIVFDAGFNPLKAANFAANRKGYFHYSIFTHRYDNAANGSSGIAEINADDFMVTLQTFLSDSNVSKTFMHELGHNLNLRHGGNENRNYKPNYNSIMSYRFQFPGIDGPDCNSFGNGILDYSVGTRIALDENALNEAAGVCGAVAIDWNGAGGIQNPVARNINCSAGTTTACGVGAGACYDAVCNAYTDFNDWANIVYATNLAGGDKAGIEWITCQDTPEAEVVPEAEVITTPGRLTR